VARVFSEVLRTVNDVSFAPEVVYSVGDALGVDTLLGALAKVLTLPETVAFLDAGFEHFARLLAQFGVVVTVGFEVLLPRGFYKRGHITAAAAQSFN